MRRRSSFLGGVVLGVALALTVGRAASLGLTSETLSIFRPSILPSPPGIVLDSTGSAPSAGKVTSHSWNHTVGPGSNRILVVGVSLRKHDMSVSTITYGGVGGFVRVGTQIGGGADHRIEIWYKLAPAVGTASIQITLTGGAAVEVVGGSASFNGVHQTTPTGSFVSAQGTSQTPSVTATSASGEVVFDVLSISGDTGSVSVGGGQTVLWTGRTGTGDGNEFGGASTELGAASVTMSWAFGNSNKWAIGAVPLRPA